MQKKKKNMPQVIECDIQKGIVNHSLLSRQFHGDNLLCCFLSYVHEVGWKDGTDASQ